MQSLKAALYPRGFILCQEDHAARASVPGWASTPIADLTLCHDSRVNRSAASSPSAQLILLGRALDPFVGEWTTQAVCDRLHAALESSWGALYQALETVTGRFVLFAVRSGLFRVVQDATGVQSVVYDVAGNRVASHASLLDERFGYAQHPLFLHYLDPSNRRGSVKYLPGLLTPCVDVLRLTPNTALDVKQGTVARFFPVESNAANSLESVVAPAAEILSETATLLARSTPIAMSLTSGIDSRVSLAATRPIADDIVYFTYILTQRPVHTRDGAIAAELCARYSLTHTIYRPNPKLQTPELREFQALGRLSQSGVRSEHFLRLAFDLSHKWPVGRVHLKSSLSEVGRAFYRRRPTWQDVSGLDPRSLAVLYAALEPTEPVVAAFDEFCARTNFTRAMLHNYEWSDLFYWEHRMGTWHTLQVADMDAVHDTFLLFNNRRLLALLLSSPLEVRLADQVPRELIRRLWPALLDLPFNPIAAKPSRIRRRLRARLLKYRSQVERLWVRSRV